MASYTITNPSIVEDTEFTFYIKFRYDLYDLKTVSMPRSSPVESVKNNVVDAINRFLDQKADTTYALIKKFAEKDSITITV